MFGWYFFFPHMNQFILDYLVKQEVLFPLKPHCQKVINLAQRLETQGTAFLAVSRLSSVYKNTYGLHAGLIFGWSYFPGDLQILPNKRIGRTADKTN